MSTPSSGYVTADYLDAAAAITARAKRHAASMLQLRPGDAVLDVGCGPGIDTLRFWQQAAPAGRVIGIDHDLQMVVLGNQRARMAGAGRHVIHMQADAEQLPFERGEFSACHCDRLFQHLADPERVLTEMVRVVRPAGRIVVTDTDWATLSIDAAPAGFERRLSQVLPGRLRPSGYIARHLYALFRRHQLTEISIELTPILITSYAMARPGLSLDDIEREALSTGVATGPDIQNWRDTLAAADERHEFCCSVTLYTVAGRVRTHG